MWFKSSILSLFAWSHQFVFSSIYDYSSFSMTVCLLFLMLHTAAHTNTQMPLLYISICTIVGNHNKCSFALLLSIVKHSLCQTIFFLLKWRLCVFFRMCKGTFAETFSLRHFKITWIFWSHQTIEYIDFPFNLLPIFFLLIFSVISFILSFFPIRSPFSLWKIFCLFCNQFNILKNHSKLFLSQYKANCLTSKMYDKIAESALNIIALQSDLKGSACVYYNDVDGKINRNVMRKQINCIRIQCKITTQRTRKANQSKTRK